MTWPASDCCWMACRSELPFLTQLYALITTVRTTHENKMLSDAYELVALVRKEVSEDEGM